MEKNLNLLKIATFILGVVLLVCYRWSLEEQYSGYDKQLERSLIEKANSEQTWVISYQQAVREGEAEVDVSNSLICVAYTDSNSVDIFNRDGEFQYALLFPDKSNGGMSARFYNGLLYVRDKYSNLYIFDGIHEVQTITPEQANAAGYKYDWFQEKEEYNRISGNILCRLDEEGNVIEEVTIPFRERKINILRMILLLVTVCVYVIILVKTIKYRIGA